MSGRHVMLDLETFGTKPGSVVRSIGAVVFGLRSGFGEEFYCNIDRDSCLAAGLTVDPKTEQWWAQQGAAAERALFFEPRPLSDVAADFHAWFRRVGGEFIWSQGANFDGPLWEAAAAAVNAAVPWKFYNARDTRTVYDICGFDAKSMPRSGTYHNALDDAKHQARMIQAALNAAAARSATINSVTAGA